MSIFKLTRIFFFCTLICLCYSCRKDVDICTSVYADSDFIAAGSNCLEVQLINRTLSSSSTNSLAKYKIDLNADTIPDLEVHHTTHPTLLYCSTWISCLHENIFLGVETETQSVYNYKTIAYNFSNPVEKTITSFMLCVLPDTACSVTQAKITRYCNPNDIIHLSDSWINGSATLCSDKISMNTGQMGVTDTISYFNSVFDLTCFNIEFGSSKYIPLKQTVQGVEKLGWIKLRMKDRGSVTIEQVAIQR